MVTENAGAVGLLQEAAALAELGKAIYQPHYLAPTLARFPEIETDWLEALKFFLYGYAFERQGRSPAYAPLAVEAIRVTIGENRPEKPTRELTKAVWEKFCDLGNYHPRPTKPRKPKHGKQPKPADPYEGANKKNNPLYQSTGKQDVITFCSSLVAHRYNIFVFAKSGIQAQIRETHSKLCEIRGVGEKIASFFLRDVALQSDNRIADSDRELLQPVDIWVRRTARLLSQNSITEESDAMCAQEMVRLSHEAQCSDLLLNAGSWYFGSQVAGTLRDLQTALANSGSLSGYLEKRADWLRHEVEVLEALDLRLTAEPRIK